MQSLFFYYSITEIGCKNTMHIKQYRGWMVMSQDTVFQTGNYNNMIMYSKAQTQLTNSFNIYNGRKCAHKIQNWRWRNVCTNLTQSSTHSLTLQSKHPPDRRLAATCSSVSSSLCALWRRAVHWARNTPTSHWPLPRRDLAVCQPQTLPDCKSCLLRSPGCYLHIWALLACASYRMPPRSLWVFEHPSTHRAQNYRQTNTVSLLDFLTKLSEPTSKKIWFRRRDSES